MTVLRLVMVADTHCAEADLGPLPAGDVLIHCGDMLRAGTLEELAPVAAWISRQPHPHKVIVPGNHDGCFESQPEAARNCFSIPVHILDDEALTLDGLRLFGAPRVPDYPQWAYHLPRAEAAAHYDAFSPSIDVLVSHGPPRGFGDVVPDQGSIGCDGLAAFSRRCAPVLHVFGHVHQDGGVSVDRGTAFINVTTWDSTRGPTVVDVDTHQGALTFVSVPPRRPRVAFVESHA